MTTTNLLVQKDIESETNRQVKGYEIFKNGQVVKLNDSEYLVKDTYIVQDLDSTLLDYDGYTCTCPDYQYRGLKGYFCKHILGVTFYQVFNEYNNGA